MVGDQPYDKRGFDVYVWHIEQRRKANANHGIGMDRGKDIANYANDAINLFESMSEWGFKRWYPIPIDPNGELLDGSHRTACALALGIDCYVQQVSQCAWAPNWDRLWFIGNGMSEEDLTRTLADWNTMCNG